ncbi:unnamed protein product [Paramecium octaurelia]|nr:unnamed protein product [Paramecium octaurelia]
MLEQKCGCSPDHQENIIGICLSDKCVNNAIFCYLCLKQFHSEHQQQCQTFKILYNQLILEQNELQIYVNYVKEFKVIFDEIYKKQLEKNQENIEKLNSINLRMKDKSYYPTYSDIHFLKSNKASLQNFKQWISRLEWIEKQVYNQNDYNDHDQNDDKTETLKVDTEQDQTDNQTIDPQSVEIDLKKCEELIQLKEYSLAIQNMQKGIELNPQGAIQLIQQNINLINSQNLSQLEASNLRDIIHQAKKIIDENQSLEETNNLSDDKKQEKQNEIIEIEKTFKSYLVELNQIISDYQDGKYQKE